MISFSWDKRISRAEQLAGEYPAGAEILRFYAHVTRFQKDVYDQLRSHPANGANVGSAFPELLHLVQRIGPPALAEEARRLETERATHDDVVAASAASEDMDML